MASRPTLRTPIPRVFPRTPFGRLLLPIGAILAAGLILGGAATLLDVAARHTYVVRTSYAAVRSLSISDEGGDIHLTGAPAGSRLTVTQSVSEALTSPHRTATLGPAGRLELAGGCGGLVLECRVAYTVAVPTGLPVDVEAGAGDVTASGLHTSAAIRLNSSAGDVSASDVSSSFLLLTSGAGKIVGTRLDSPQVGLSSGDGDITAELTGQVDRLVANSHAGSVTLRVPNSTYDLHTSAASGTVSDATVRTDPAAPRSIAASSGAGDIRITPNG